MIKILLFITLIIQIKAARILGVVPTPSISHQQVFIPIFKELARRGHELVLLTTLPINDPDLPNIREITWKNTEFIEKEPKVKEIFTDTSFCGMKPLFFLTNALRDACMLQLEDERVQALIKNESEHFDLVMLEYLNPTMFAFKHRFNATFIGLLSMDVFNVHHEIVGNSVHSVLFPERILSFQGEIPFYCRMAGFMIYKVMSLFQKAVTYEYNKGVKKYFGDNYPPVSELENSVDLLLMNSNPAFFKPRPVAPATINIYGLHVRKIKPLPEDLKKYLDESSSGVIYFSLGSNVNDKFLSSNLLNIFKTVLGELPYKILWKYENETMENQPKNVLIRRWFPQQDVLAHPNVKLFITQCGLQSLEEALFNHIPVFGIPIMFDQWINSNYVKERGFGMAVDYRKLTYEEFKTGITTILNNLTR